jgi:capsule polysaccharide export protein KpsE/RkpR
MVRPGITGWAQVNGGKQITSEEKDQLDEWYIRNASLMLDFRILLLTFRYVFAGDRFVARASAEVTLRIGKDENAQNSNSAVMLASDFNREVA